MRALLPILFLAGFVSPAHAESFEVLGYAGVLGEWELTATVTDNNPQPAKEFSGPLTVRHVGICSQDGPEEKTGEIRFRFSSASSASNATVVIAGETCTYTGGFSETHPGTIACPEKGPMPLTLWLKPRE